MCLNYFANNGYIFIVQLESLSNDANRYFITLLYGGQVLIMVTYDKRDKWRWHLCAAFGADARLGNVFRDAWYLHILDWKTNVAFKHDLKRNVAGPQNSAAGMRNEFGRPALYKPLGDTDAFVFGCDLRAEGALYVPIDCCNRQSDVSGEQTSAIYIHLIYVTMRLIWIQFFSFATTVVFLQ